MMKKASSLKQEAYQKLKHKIIWNEISQGEPLREVQLSEELKISRTPVREAIGQLVQDGLAVYNPGRGCTVKVFDASDVYDLYELREQLEVFALKKIVHSISPESLHKLKECCEHFKVLLERVKTENEDDGLHRIIMEVNATDMNFHLQLLLNARNKYVRKVTSDLNILSNVIMLSHHGNIKSKEEIIKEINGSYIAHKSIYDAIECGDVEKASAIVSEHLQSARRNVVKYIESRNLTPEKDWSKDVTLTLQMISEDM